jgi:hypothetical protein
MRRMPGLCLRCHPDQVMKGGNTKVHICDTTGAGRPYGHVCHGLSRPSSLRLKALTPQTGRGLSPSRQR